MQSNGLFENISFNSNRTQFLTTQKIGQQETGHPIKIGTWCNTNRGTKWQEKFLSSLPYPNPRKPGPGLSEWSPEGFADETRLAKKSPMVGELYARDVC